MKIKGKSFNPSVDNIQSIFNVNAINLVKSIRFSTTESNQDSKSAHAHNQSMAQIKYKIPFQQYTDIITERTNILLTVPKYAEFQSEIVNRENCSREIKQILTQNEANKQLKLMDPSLTVNLLNSVEYDYLNVLKEYLDVDVLFNNPGRHVKVDTQYDSTLINTNLMHDIIQDNHYNILKDPFINITSDNHTTHYSINENKLILYSLDKILTYIVLNNWNDLEHSVKIEYIDYLLAKYGIQDISYGNGFNNILKSCTNMDDEKGNLEIDTAQIDHYINAINNTHLIKSYNINTDNYVEYLIMASFYLDHNLIQNSERAIVSKIYSINNFNLDSKEYKHVENIFYIKPHLNLDYYYSNKSTSYNYEIAESVFIMNSAHRDTDIHKLVDIFLAERLQGFRADYIQDSYYDRIYHVIKGPLNRKLFDNVDDMEFINLQLKTLNIEIEQLQKNFQFESKDLMKYQSKNDYDKKKIQKLFNEQLDHLDLTEINQMIKTILTSNSSSKLNPVLIYPLINYHKVSDDDKFKLKKYLISKDMYVLDLQDEYYDYTNFAQLDTHQLHKLMVQRIKSHIYSNEIYINIANEMVKL